MMLTPTYHVFRLFRPFQDATFLPTDLQTPNYSFANTSVPAISLSAARASDGAIMIAIVNLDPKTARALTVDIEGAKPKRLRGDILTAASMDAHNTFDAPNAVHPIAFSGASLRGSTLSVQMPAKSIVVLRLD